MLVCWSSYKGYLKQNVSEILQENLGNLIRGKKIHDVPENAQEKFRTMSKSYLEIQKWKTNKKFVWEMKSTLGVDKRAKVLLQSESKENQNCPGLTLGSCDLVI